MPQNQTLKRTKTIAIVEVALRPPLKFNMQLFSKTIVHVEHNKKALFSKTIVHVENTKTQ